jgi:hypothetical protein
VADEDVVLELEVVRERGDIAAEVLDRGFLRPARRGSVRAQVAGHDFMGSREKLDLLAPVFVRAKETMHENQGRGAAPLAHEVQI